MNYSPLAPCFLQAQVPDFMVCIKCVCFNTNKHSVPVQVDWACSPQSFAEITVLPSWSQGKWVLPNLHLPWEVWIRNSARSQTLLVRSNSEACVPPPIPILVKDSGKTEKKKLLSSEKVVYFLIFKGITEKWRLAVGWRLCD